MAPSLHYMGTDSPNERRRRGLVAAGWITIAALVLVLALTEST
jgi:hypothetical protein